MPRQHSREPTCQGFQQGFQVERRGSRHFERKSFGPNSPEPPCCSAIEPQSTGNVQTDAWLSAWEDRLRLREATLEAQGIRFPRSRATPVLNLNCMCCKRRVNSQGMQVYYKNNPGVDLYSSDQQPTGVRESDHALSHGLCGCHIREFECMCGMVVGYHMHQRCESCSAENDEDDGHCWLFEANVIEAEPRRDSATGETLMWPGFDFPNQEESSLEDSCYYDENAIMQRDGDTANWGCSPLSERNGRSRTSLAKPGNTVALAREAELAQKEAALVNIEQEFLNREAAHFEADLSQGAREKFLRDATAQQDSTDKELVVRENEIATRETALNNCKLALDLRERQLNERAQQQVQGADDAAKRELEKAQRDISIVEAEADAVRLQLNDQKRIATAAEERVASQNIEIQQLHAALAEVRREVRKSSGGAGIVSRGRLPPADEDFVPPEALSRRVRELEQQLTAERVELAAVRVELQQASQRLECKEAEVDRLLPEIAASRMQGNSRLRQQLQQNMDVQQGSQLSQHNKDAELERLRRDLDLARAELSQLRPELERLRCEAATRPTTTKAESDEFVQARLAVAQKLSEKRMELEKREQELAAREASLPQGMAGFAAQRFGPGGQPVRVPAFYGGSGVPDTHSGGLGGLLERIGCVRRQPMGYYAGRSS